MIDPHITGTKDSGEYRDHLSTIDKEGKRIWIYPKKPKGKFYNARTWVSYLLLAILFSGPFLTISGHPVLLLDILNRKFYILGFRFWPQDLVIFGLAFIALIIFIILFTVVFGRIFCGWVCPQTIFMEMVFRKIEYLIEGDGNDQRRLNNSPWTSEKIFKKSLKHIIFYFIAFLIGNTFLAYIIGKDELIKIITEAPNEHIGGLFSMIVFSTMFYIVFSWLREQACTLICPYGRLQGVLLDQNSIVVHYDFLRGEPRGKGKKSRSDELGDCVDCHLCVRVCPTGIDIRNGTQLECVNCTACIDACDAIMDNMDLPRGLIRHASYNSIKSGVKKIFTTRAAGYSTLLTVLVILVSALLFIRTPIEATILRTPGIMYQVLDGERIQNLYNIKIMNKTYNRMPINLETVGNTGEIVMVSEMVVESDSISESAFFVILPASNINGKQTEISINVYAGEELITTVNTSFIGPEK